MTGSSDRPGGAGPIADVAAVGPSPAHSVSRELYACAGHDFELSLDVKDPAALAPILAAADGIGGQWTAVAVPPRLGTLLAAGGPSVG